MDQPRTLLASLVVAGERWFAIKNDLSAWWWTHGPSPAGNFTSSRPAARPCYAAGRGSPLRPARVRRAREDLVRRAGGARGSGPAGGAAVRSTTGPVRSSTSARRPGRPRPLRHVLRTRPWWPVALDGRRPGPAAMWISTPSTSSGREGSAATEPPAAAAETPPAPRPGRSRGCARMGEP